MTCILRGALPARALHATARPAGSSCARFGFHRIACSTPRVFLRPVPPTNSSHISENWLTSSSTSSPGRTRTVGSSSRSIDAAVQLLAPLVDRSPHAPMSRGLSAQRETRDALQPLDRHPLDSRRRRPGRPSQHLRDHRPVSSLGLAVPRPGIRAGREGSRCSSPSRRGSRWSSKPDRGLVLRQRLNLLQHVMQVAPATATQRPAHHQDRLIDVELPAEGRARTRCGTATPPAPRAFSPPVALNPRGQDPPGHLLARFRRGVVRVPRHAALHRAR